MPYDPQAAGEFSAAIVLHYGPGPHPDGSPQQAHAGGAQPFAPLRRALKPGPAAPSAFAAAATAGRVAQEKQLGGGVTDSRLVDYVDDGQGVWKALDDPNSAHDGHAEIAAYRLARLLGMDCVPETVYATRNGQVGTSQRFIANLQVGLLPARRAIPDQTRLEDMLTLDTIISNRDRHNANWGVDAAGRVWAIDHGHAGFTARGTLRIGPAAESITAAQGPVSDVSAFVRARVKKAPAKSPERRALEPHIVSGGADGISAVGWRVGAAKRSAWRKITADDFVRAAVPPYAVATLEVRAAWRQRAERAFDNLQKVLHDGYLTLV